MSGGAYNYAYFDAEEAGRTVETMADDMAERDDVPDHVAEELRELSEIMKWSSEFLRAVEWYASGDVGPDAVTEEYDNLPVRLNEVLVDDN
jgi:hypothetical protein